MRGFSVSIHRVQRHNHWGQSHRGKIITIGRLVSARVLHRYPCRHSTLSLSFSLSLSSPLPPPLLPSTLGWFETPKSPVSRNHFTYSRFDDPVQNPSRRYTWCSLLLLFYNDVTYRVKGSNLYAPWTARSTNNNTNDILLSILSLSLSLPIAVRALFEPCTFDSDRTVTLATFE